MDLQSDSGLQLWSEHLPVSYTHLGNSPVEGFLHYRSDRCSFIGCNYKQVHSFFDEITDIFYPVSYTHLDVYKRQGANFEMLKAVGKVFDGMTFRIQVDVLDCLGCGNCCLLYTSRCV